MAIVILAAVVLLPAWHRRCEAIARSEAVAQRVALNAALIAHRRELIEAARSDPHEIQRLLMTQQNLRQPGTVPLVTDDVPADPPLLAMLAAQARTTPPAEPGELLATAARRVQQPATRRGLLLLAGICLLTAMALFPAPHTD